MKRKVEIKSPKIINLPKILDTRGNLSFLESGNHIPFNIKRTYWIYDVPGGEVRGGHAFKLQNEFIIVLSGSLDVIVHDGINEMKYSLNRSYYGLFIPNQHWRHMENFATNTLALVVSDQVFDVEDYIRDRSEFKKLKKNNVP